MSRLKAQGSRQRQFGEKKRGRSLFYRAPAVFLLLPLLALFVAGCGYHLVREEGIRGGEVKVVDVPMFKNNTFEPHTPAIFTESLTHELILSGFFQINKSNPDGTLQGTVTRIVTPHSSLNTQGIVVEKTAIANVELTLTKMTGQVVRRWKLTDSEPYRVDNVNLEDFNKRAALKRVADRMGRRFTALILAEY